VDDRIWKNISIVLGVACALLIGVAGALMIVGNKGGSSAATSAPQESEVAAASTAPATSLPSGALQSQGPNETVGPTPTPGKASPATITFNSLALDASNDAKGTARTFTFTSDGAGPVTYAVTQTSAGGTTKMCAKVDSSAYACKVGSLPNFLKGMADGPHNIWTVTLVGYGSSKPTVDVTFTWPTASPKIMLSHGRFQGSTTAGVAEALNGFTATFKPRVGGTINVQATWTVVTADASMTLLDATTTPSVTVDARQYKGVTYINPAFTANVDPTKTYVVELRNDSADNPSPRPDLTAQVSFP
jgi:hypothetical protein